MLFDTHCHLTDPAFAADLPQVLERARAAGVERLVAIASRVADTVDALTRLADGRAVWTTAGVHPHEAAQAGEDDFARIRELAAREQVVALGECGLDFHYDNSPRDVQRTVFHAQVQIAADTGLPLVVHSRAAEADTAAVLRDLPPGVRGVLHCFSGGEDLLEAALSQGWYVSVTGIVTFRRFEGAGWLRAVPDDRLMLETDSPYLAPVPHRGKRNEPAFLAHVARAVAGYRSQSLEEVIDYTTRNANRFFSLEP